LIYLEGSTLHRLDLGTGRSRKFATFPSRDVYAYAGDYLVVEDRAGGDDFAQDPFLTLRNETGKVLADLGPGFSPLPNRSGSVAYLRPVEERVCEGETCAGGLEVMRLGPQMEPIRVLPAGNWGLLAWAGEDIIVADGSQPDSALVVGPGGEVSSFPFAPNEVWDAWPSGAIVVEDDAEILDIPNGNRTPIAIDGSLADGTVRASDALAVELLGGGSRLLSISLDDGEVRPVPGSRGAMGPVLSLDEGDAFAYARADGLDVEAVVCEAIETCSPVLRWSEGITLLALL
jgi:hypothetical protein